MRVIAYDPYVSKQQMQQVGNGVEKAESMDEVLTQADFVFLPYSVDSRNGGC